MAVPLKVTLLQTLKVVLSEAEPPVALRESMGLGTEAPSTYMI